MHKITETLSNDIVSLFAKTPRKKHRFYAMKLIANIALEAVDGDPMNAIAILECAKLDLHQTLGIYKEPNATREGLDSLMN